MSEKKFTWKKKHGTGINVLIVDGERRTVKPGDHLEASIFELGSFAGQYEPASPSTRKRALTPLEIETAKHEVPLKEKSIWLNPKYRPGIGSIENVPNDVKGLRNVLAGKQSEGFTRDGSPDGEMGSCKIQLHEAWKAWKHQVKTDPKQILSIKEPQEPYLTAIARAQAALNVLNLEIKELKIRLELAEQTEAKQVNNRAEKLKYHGFAQHRNHRYHEVDGRRVEYKENKPYFKDDGSSVLEYLDTCKRIKTEKNEKAKAERAAFRKERREMQEAAAQA